jgi:Ca2+-transporting ATPase
MPSPLTHGLDDTEAIERLRVEGPNELPHQARRSVTHIAAEVLREPMLAMLMGAGIIYMALGDLQEALILVGLGGFSILITVIQESRSERALDALRDLTSPRALVIRDGIRKRIAAREVVRGDLVVLSEGDRVPADGWVAENMDLRLDESLLTGESVPVRKIAGQPSTFAAAARPGGDGLPFVWSGSLVVGGSGLCVVTATGRASEIGRIGTALSTIETETPRLRLQTRRLVLWFAAAGVMVSTSVFVLYWLLRGAWLEAALAAIALGMSMLPEEFPVVLTIFMAMGALRMSRGRVLTRRAAAIETLGAATILCTDKTGTLTENRMRIAELRLPDGRVLLPETRQALEREHDFHLMAELGILASSQAPIDPMEIAFHELGDALAPVTVRGRQDAGWSLEKHYPLDPALLAMTHAWSKVGSGEERFIAAKGAPEAIADLCRLSEAEREALRQSVDVMAERGLRVLGLADAHWDAEELPPSQRDFSFLYRGLVGLADPLRASVPAAVRQCREAGIRVMMITGDYPQTARAIAHQAGIDAQEVLTGDEMAAMSDTILRQRIGSVGVCARIMPEQKLRLVELLKQSGEIVAMTGDGVNDAPSLKAAHIGVAMGGRGTDVAREASAIVLLDDDFGSIVKAVRMGRRIYDNLRKAMGFIMAVHIPIAGLALMPLLTGLPLLLGPIHIAFLEMIIDPVCSLAFEAEPEEQDVMARPPRRPESPLFSRALVVWSFLQGGVALSVTGGLAWHFAQSGMAEEQLRSSAFMALVAIVVGLILVNRRYSVSIAAAFSRASPALLIVLGAVAAILLATQSIPQIAALFGFTSASLADVGLILLAAAAMLVLLERLKPWWSKRLAG